MYLLIAANDKRHAELGLFDPADVRPAYRKVWACDRQLSQTLLANLKELLQTAAVSFKDLSGIGVFEGPAGFTDLRITHTVANTLAYGLGLPVVNASGPDWRQACRQRLAAGENDGIVKPDYGRPPTVTARKK